MRKPVSTEDGRVLYYDSNTGKFYEKPEESVKVKGLVALTEPIEWEPGDPKIVLDNPRRWR